MHGIAKMKKSVKRSDWRPNQSSERYWVLKLIKDSLHRGDKLVETSGAQNDAAAQAFITRAGHKLFLANKRNRAVEMALPDAEKASALTNDDF
jgi:hypothetical protein